MILYLSNGEDEKEKESRSDKSRVSYSSELIQYLVNLNIMINDVIKKKKILKEKKLDLCDIQVKLNQVVGKIDTDLLSIKRSSINPLGLIISKDLFVRNCLGYREARKYLFKTIKVKQMLIKEIKVKTANATESVYALSSMQKSSIQLPSTQDAEMNNYSDKTNGNPAKRKLFCLQKDYKPIARTELSALIMNVIKNMTSNPIDELYANNLWDMIQRKIIATVGIEYKQKSNPMILVSKTLTEENKDIESKVQWDDLKNVEVVLLLKNSNCSVACLIDKMKQNSFKEWMIMKSKKDTLIIRGILKVSYSEFENVFMDSSLLLNTAIITIYYTKGDLFRSPPKEFEITNINKEHMCNYINEEKALQKLRDSISYINKDN